MTTAADAPITRVAQELAVPYRHAVGYPLARFLAGLKDRRILGVHCPACDAVLVPPAALCATCLVPPDYWVDLPTTGVVKAFSVVNMSFPGQPVPPPFVYAEIVVDGSATTLVHRIGGIDLSRAKEEVRIGQPVEAVWRDERVGSPLDIDYFKPRA